MNNLVIALITSALGLTFVAGFALFFGGWTALLVTLFGWFMVLVAFVSVNLLSDAEEREGSRT